jgi:SAM-dependent methyltransferase
VRECYVQQWLSALVSAGYVEYDLRQHRFALPLEHALVLSHKYSPRFLGDLYQQLPALLEPFEQLAAAFRQGVRAPLQAHDRHFWAGIAGFIRSWFEYLFVPHWLPAVPDIQARLAHGIRVANVGCGQGWGLITLAQAFPHSYYIGYDAFEATIDRARMNAEAVDVAERVRFRAADVVEGLPEQYDLILTFDLGKNMADVRGSLGAIRKALRPEASYLMLEINDQHLLQENTGALGALFYGTSVLYGLSVVLAHGDEALGSVGLPESQVQELCAEIGFSRVRRLPLAPPFSVLYEVKP